MSKLPRRSFLQKVGLGLVAFIPAARTLASSGGNVQGIGDLQPSRALGREFTTLGGLSLDDVVSTVVAKLGQPSKVGTAHGHGGQEWNYAELGVTVTFTAPAGLDLRVRQIDLLLPSAGATAAGIRVGSRVADVKKIHEGLVREPNAENLIIDLAPGRSLVFMRANGFITGISVQEDACPTCTYQDVEGPLEFVQ